MRKLHSNIHEGRRGRRGLVSLASITVLAMTGMLSACSSSGSGAAGDTSAPPGGAVTSLVPSSTNDAAGQSAAAASADAFIAPYLKPPTSTTITQPLKEKPPAGKTFDYLECDVPECAQILDGVREAAAALGWTVKVYPTKNADPATLISAMDQALQDKPVGVGFTGVPYQLWQGEVSKYAAAGIPLLPTLAGEVPLSNAVPANIGPIADYARNGELLGAWFASDSKGSGHALLVTLGEIPSQVTVADSVKQSATKYCLGCKVTSLNVTTAQLAGNQVNGAVVSALQKDPSIKYVIATYSGLITSLSSAVAGAGLPPVTLEGDDGNSQNQVDVKKRGDGAFTSLSPKYIGWLEIDAAARVATGSPFPTGYGSLATQLLTDQTITTPKDYYDYPTGYQAELKRLWQG